MPLYEIAELRSATQVIITFVGAILLFVLTSCGQADLPTTTSVSTAPAPTTSPTGSLSSPTPLPTRTYSPEALTAIAVKEANLQAERDHDATRAAISPAPTLTRAQWDATKIAILDATEHERQTRVASGTPFASTPIPLTQVEPVTTPVLGISGECMDPSTTVDVGNCWAARINDEYVFVAALVKKSDPAQGLLHVYTTTVGISYFGPANWYATPTHSGLIRVVDATGYRLTLRAEDGNIFYFDVLTRQWVTLTPAPSPIPSLLPTP